MRLLSIKQAREQLGGISTGRIYELFGTSQIDAVKLDGRTMVVAASVDRFIAALPRAVITTQPRRQPGTRPAGRPAKQKPAVQRERL